MNERENNDDESLTEFIESDPIAYQISQNDEYKHAEVGTSEDWNIFEETTKETTEETTQKPSLWRYALDTIWPRYILDHLDYGSFKVVFRTWVQVWCTVILFVVPKTRIWIGTAGYLMQIVGFIAVSGGTPIILNVYISVICFFYFLVGWLFSVVSLAITSHIRGWITSEELGRQLIQEGVCTKDNIQTCLQQQIFTGRYLETRCSAVFIISMIVGITCFGLSQRLNPLLRVGFVLGMISIVVLHCYSAFFPIFSPTLVGYSILKPMGIGFAVKIICSILIFPSSASFQYFSGSTGILKGLQSTNKKNIRFLRTLKPSQDNYINYQKYPAIFTDLRNKVSQLEPIASLIKFEFSFSRFDAGDVGEFRYQVKNLISVMAGYQYFYQLLGERKEVISDGLRSISRRGSAASSYRKNSTGQSKILAALQEAYKSVGRYETHKRNNLLKQKLYSHDSEDRLTLADLDDVTDLIKTNFISLVEAADTGIEAIVKWLEAANEFRQYTLLFPSKYRGHQQKQRECYEEIIKAKQVICEELESWRDHKRIELIIQKSTNNEEALLCFISQASFFLRLSKDHCTQILKMIELFISIDETKPNPKLISYFTTSNRDKPTTFNISSEDPVESIPEFWKRSVSSRDPDALPPSNLFHVIGMKYLVLYNLMMNKHVWFWIRYAGLVVICAIPFFCRPTAEWYYANRLVWIPITCALNGSEYMGETIYGTASRFLYAFFGCIVAMIAWYISTGNGNGNYYGYGAVTAILYFYLAYYRHFSVHLTLVPAILYCVTVALVLGTSWINGQFNTQPNIGVGFAAAWVRFVCVAIGLAISVIGCCIPRPVNSKVVVRNILAKSLEQIGHLHCDVTRFAIIRSENPNTHILPRHDVNVQNFRTILLRLASISKLMIPIKHEIPLSGVWPESKYQRLQALITDIVQLYFMIHRVFDEVRNPDEWVPRIFDRMGWSSASLNANVFSILHMSSGSLKTKTELPKITEATLSLNHLDLLREQWGINTISLNERFYSKISEDEPDEEPEEDPSLEEKTNEDLHESMENNLDYEKLFSNDGQCNIVALLFAHMIYKRLDDTLLIVKGLVGEKYDIDYTIFKDEFDETANLI